MPRSWVALTALFVCAARAHAQAPPAVEPPRVAAKSHYLIDYATGRVLAASNEDQRVPPASLTKLMTAYVVFKALEDGRIALTDQVRVSEKAWRMGGTRMFIEVNSEVAVAELIRGMLIQSGNDASVALAEHVSGSVDEFVKLMNEHAAALGMPNSQFRNPTGLPARDHYSSARDLATLARALIAEFPAYYGLYREREYTYNGIKQHNRNRLLWRDPSVDGLKTGHTSAAGYCIVTSAERDGMRLIAVVLGADTPNARVSAGQKLLDYGFEAYETHRLYAAGEEISTARVWGGQPEVTPLGLAADLFVTIPRGLYAALTATMDLRTDLRAPLAAGVAVGEVKIALHGTPISRMPVVVLRQVDDGGAWARLRDEVSTWLE